MSRTMASLKRQYNIIVFCVSQSSCCIIYESIDIWYICIEMGNYCIKMYCVPIPNTYIYISINKFNLENLFTY